MPPSSPPFPTIPLPSLSGALFRRLGAGSLGPSTWSAWVAHSKPEIQQKCSWFWGSNASASPPSEVQGLLFSFPSPFPFSFHGCSQSDFLWASISLRFLMTFCKKNEFFGPSREGTLPLPPPPPLPPPLPPLPLPPPPLPLPPPPLPLPLNAFGPQPPNSKTLNPNILMLLQKAVHFSQFHSCAGSSFCLP